jgi:hypothetical protein
MRRIGLLVACGAFALLAFGCDNGRTTGGTDGGGITLPDSGPPPRDSGTPPRPDSGPTMPPTDCSSLASFQTCAECYCNANAAGCQGYFNALITNLYCGSTCGTACADFCADPANVMPSSACESCAGGIADPNADLDGFIADCQADSSCVGFVQSLQMCPGA